MNQKKWIDEAVYGGNGEIFEIIEIPNTLWSKKPQIYKLSNSKNLPREA